MTQTALVQSEPPSSPRIRTTRRLRARRIRVDELKLGQMTATAEHAALGRIQGVVEDLSLAGMALVLPGAAPTGSLVLIGDRLQHLRVRAGEGPFYEGTAAVRRVSDRDGDLVLGIELDARGIDLGELYRLDARHGFAERLHAVVGEQGTTQISVEFKAWVADLRADLATTKSFLDSEEHALESLDMFSREQALQSYLAEVAPQVVERMNAASHELRLLVERLPEDQHPAHRAYFRAHVLPLLIESPLLRRAFEKPLGYAGDYEMMNMLYRDHAEGPSLFAKALNVYAAQEPAAQANINRLTYLGNKIRSVLEASPDGRLRLASIGCGPARELALLLEQSPELGPRLDVALIDQEPRVITYCERTLGPLAARTGARVQFIRESVRHLLTARQLSTALGERDFIYSAGLFDYLNQRSFTSLLTALYEALAPGGQLAVGNVAAHNPTRWFMEYCLDWFLIHRSPDDLTGFARGLQPTPGRIEVDSEPLGVNLFLRVWR
jgi:extracellular factor (EF) 3-hydroxypalmitic acid methyl ester biosynthesis protein